MREVAREHGIVLIVPWYEEEQPGVYYNTACVIERDGTVLGKYRKTHIPHVGPCFWEKFYFKPGNLGYPVFDTSVGRVGLIICYDRHFPEVARELGLKGAELVFNPSATVESLSRYLWELEQPAHAVANGFWIAASNRVGVEAPLNPAKFYGSSYFCSPRGKIIAQASDSEDEVLVADLDLDEIREVRNTWQFFRDRRPGDLRRAGWTRQAAMTHTLIKNGTVVTATDMARADVLIDGERIQAVGTGLAADGRTTGHRRHGPLRDAGRHRRAHPHGAPVRRHLRLRRLRHRHRRRGLGRHHHDRRLRRPGLRREPGPGAGHLAGEGRAEVAHRLRPAPDRARDQRRRSCARWTR